MNKKALKNKILSASKISEKKQIMDDIRAKYAYEILNRLADEDAKIPFKLPEGHDNAFEEIGISRNIFMQMSLGIMSIENLNEKFINPALRNMFPDYAKSFNYSSTTINQSEICFDIPAASKEEVREILPEAWCITGYKSFLKNDNR